MCTVTYIPLDLPSFENLEGLSNNFILTSNRDEKTARPQAIFPTKETINGVEVTFPLDPQGGGTWIASSLSKTVCLLNGAFEPHIPKLKYKHSRGWVPKAYFGYDSAAEFVEKYDFEGIEPFTLVIKENENLFEIRWDEKDIFSHRLDEAQSHIWSSVTLYSPEIRVQREYLFEKWLSEHKALLTQNPNLIFEFHQFENKENEGILINRNEWLKTVSISSIRKMNSTLDFEYRDLKI